MLNNRGILSGKARDGFSAPPDTFQDLLRSAETSAPEFLDTPSFALTQPWAAPSRTEIPAGLVGHPRYRLARVIGAGGMGTVWLAEHLVLNRPVAVKLIRADLLAKPGAAERFRQEVRAAARLSHPNIVTVHDAAAAGNTHFLWPRSWRR